MKRPGVERKHGPHLTAEQAKALLEAARGDRLETLSHAGSAGGSVSGDH